MLLWEKMSVLERLTYGLGFHADGFIGIVADFEFDGFDVQRVGLLHRDVFEDGLRKNHVSFDRSILSPPTSP